MCPSTYVEVYDVNAPLDIPWKDFDLAKAALEAHQRSGSSHFDWKLDAQSIGEKVGWELWERSSYMYFVVSGCTFSCPQPSRKHSREHLRHKPPRKPHHGDASAFQSIGKKVGWELWERSFYMCFVVSGCTSSCPQPSRKHSREHLRHKHPRKIHRGDASAFRA